jgi:hypothetical protein
MGDFSFIAVQNQQLGIVTAVGRETGDPFPR